MLSYRSSAHVPLNAKFMAVLLLIDFTLVIISIFGIAGKLPGSVGFWCCVFVSTIGMSFFIAGMVALAGSIRFFCTLHQREQLQAAITGKKRVKQRSSTATNQYHIVYYPKISYVWQGKEQEYIGNFGSSHPKWSVGEHITLYADTQTGLVMEKQDSFSGFGLGLFAVVLGGGLTALFWALYFNGMLVS